MTLLGGTQIFVGDKPKLWVRMKEQPGEMIPLEWRTRLRKRLGHIPRAAWKAIPKFRRWLSRPPRVSNEEREREIVACEARAAKEVIDAFPNGTVKEFEFLATHLMSIETRQRQFNRRLDTIESKTFMGLLRKLWKKLGRR